LAIPTTLARSFGANICGVYAEIIADGPISIGDTISESMIVDKSGT